MSAATEEFNELMRDKARRSTHPDDDQDDARSFLNLSDDDEDDDDTPAASHTDYDDDPLPRQSTSISRNTIPTTRYDANTGPKGVIADAQNFRDSRRSRRISLRSNSNLQTQLADRRASQQQQQQTYSEKIAETSDGELDEEDEEDDDFMREWRQTRLRQMQSSGRERKGHHSRGEKSRRLWGGLPTVDGSGYLDAVDRSPEDTVVVVFIYDDYVC